MWSSSSASSASRRTLTAPGGAVERGGGALPVTGGGLVALDPGAQALERAGALAALALDSLGQAALRPKGGLQLGAPHGAGALVGRLAAAGDDPLGAADRLGGLRDLASGAPERHLGLLACGVRRPAASAACSAAARAWFSSPAARSDSATSSSRRRRSSSTRSAPPAGAWESSPGGAVQKAPAAGDGEPGEVPWHRVERVDHPDAVEKPLGERRDAGLGAHVREEGPAAGRRGPGVRRGRTPLSADQGGAALLAGAVQEALAGGQVVHERGRQARAQRRRECELVAGLDVDRLRQRARAVRSGAGGAEELVRGGEVGAGLRGAGPCRLHRALGLAALRRRASTSRSAASSAGPQLGGHALEPLALGQRRAPLGVERVDLVAQARLAIGLEPPDLALERADAVGG